MSYKERQQQFVSGHLGGPLLEIIGIISVPLCSYAFLQTTYSNRRRSMFFLLEFLLFAELVLVTFWSSAVGISVAVLMALVAGYRISRQRPVSANESEKLWSVSLLSAGHKRFLILYRALMMILTMAAILAVDFPLFPRRYAKVETFGISLMDVGVGCFVFSQGLVYGRHLDRPGSFHEILKAFQSSVPLLALGLVRLMMVKGSDYQEHVSEYGVHWNFFFTLGFLPPFVAIGRLFGNYLDTGLLGLVTISVYQYLLSFTGLEDWIHNAKRDNLISANKEGICSLAGYLSIFFIAARFGKLLFSPKTYRQYRHETVKVLAYVYIMLWLLYASASFNFQTSRQMANFMYVLCIVAMNAFVLLGALSLDVFILPRKNPPVLLSAINRNQLFLFLIANLLTGLVNKTMRTLDASDLVAFSVLTVYMLAISLVAMLLDGRNMTLKFW